MTTVFLQATVAVRTADHDQALAYLSLLPGLLGLEEREGDGEDLLLAAFDPVLVDQEALLALTAAPPFLRCDLEELEQRNWMEPFRDFFTPVLLGERLAVVAPAHCGSSPGLVEVVIDPGLGFGTGHHETTRLCLLHLLEYVRPGLRFLDLGTGSGILSIAAIKLGCAGALGVDMDPDALDNARGNLCRNGVEALVTLLESTAGTEFRPHELVAANIATVHLLPILPNAQACTAPGGHLIVAGFLDEERDEVLRRALGRDFSLVAERSEGRWGSLVLRRT
ncbi:MAG: hypothetical protein A2284_05275 [Deltaproteobacteria bacterium RIFOXYA12_FULL_61_11]|nr:MAG: hypothetical protein A2284_05275 [Deltaproteobacteria bacterium RIFOXYA12_FULL_61_11]